jgi:secreted PhoX family phosphatase
MTTFRRRRLLEAGGALASLCVGLRAQPAAAASPRSPLLADPRGVLDLREGFSYRILTRYGEPMSDGYRTPGRPDAMGVFPGPTPGSLVLMRNHEIPGVREWGPYRDGQAAPPEAYDPEAYGGVTRLVLDARSLELQRSNLVLTGTHWNCAGGFSPWGWLSCEETFDPRHGYVFLCPHTAERVSPPQRISAYGHFRHEAACVDPKTHIAYLTEDREDSSLYRHVPRDPQKPFEGALQALAIAGRPRFDTNEMKPGEALPVVWVDVPRPDSARDDVRLQAQANGAARFVRGEGLCLYDGELYVCATAGGPIGRGQIFQLSHRDPAHLTLLAQSEDASVLDMPDNVTVSPHGHVYVAEDGLSGNYLRHITASGGVVDLARCAISTTEFAGPCFAPDGRTMFVNLQGDGLTLAIRGPFDAIAKDAERSAAGARTPPASQGYLGVGAGMVVLALAALARRRGSVATEDGGVATKDG